MCWVPPGGRAVRWGSSGRSTQDMRVCARGGSSRGHISPSHAEHEVLQSRPEVRPQLEARPELWGFEVLELVGERVFADQRLLADKNACSNSGSSPAPAPAASGEGSLGGSLGFKIRARKHVRRRILVEFGRNREERSQLRSKSVQGQANFHQFWGAPESTNLGQESANFEPISVGVARILPKFGPQSTPPIPVNVCPVSAKFWPTSATFRPMLTKSG